MGMNKAADDNVVSRSSVLPLINPMFLHLVIFPTEQCNFRCTYCYEDFEIGRMSQETVQGVKRLLENRVPDLTQLTLSWFGGEPLMAKDIVFEITDYLTALRQENPSLSVRADMTTNGYGLTPSTLRNLLARQINNFQISLDGTAGMHDQTRKLRGEGATFRRIWQNLLGLQNSPDAHVTTLRVHVQPNRMNDLTKLVRQLKQTLLRDSRFRIMFKPVGNWGGRNADSLEVLSEDIADRCVGELRNELGGHSDQEEIVAGQNAAGNACYAARANSFIVRANGSLGKCTVLLQDERNVIGHLNPDGTLSFIPGKINPWIRGIETRDRDLLHCPAAKLGTPESAIRRMELPLT